jgi:vacuolar-type H+-ATPase subunit H
MSQAWYEFQPEEPPSSETDASTGEQVKEKAQQVVEQAKETASSAKEQVGDRLSRLVQDRSTETGEQAIRIADSIRQSVGSMREQGQDAPARMAEQAADRVQALGLYLRDNDGDHILRDVEDFARRQPLAVAAGAFALGFLGARFLKASSARRQESQPTTGPTFDDRFTPATTGGDIGLGEPSDLGVGAIHEEAPPPPDPAMDQPTDFGAPTAPEFGPTAPPTTATP